MKSMKEILREIKIKDMINTIGTVLNQKIIMTKATINTIYAKMIDLKERIMDVNFLLKKIIMTEETRRQILGKDTILAKMIRIIEDKELKTPESLHFQNKEMITMINLQDLKEKDQAVLQIMTMNID